MAAAASRNAAGASESASEKASEASAKASAKASDAPAKASHKKHEYETAGKKYWNEKVGQAQKKAEEAKVEL